MHVKQPLAPNHCHRRLPRKHFEGLGSSGGHGLSRCILPLLDLGPLRS